MTNFFVIIHARTFGKRTALDTSSNLYLLANIDNAFYINYIFFIGERLCTRAYELYLINYRNTWKIIRGWDDLFTKVKPGRCKHETSSVGCASNNWTQFVANIFKMEEDIDLSLS